MALRDQLTASQQAIESVVRDFFDSQRAVSKEIHSSLYDSVVQLETFSLRGGKSVRSFLSLTAAKLAGLPESEELYKACASVELHHKHILILDDIADRDETRYGGPTLEHAYYAVFGEDPDGKHRALSFAMLDGVLLGALSKELLLSSSFPPQVLIDCIKLFDTVMYRDTLAGWQIHGLQCIEPLRDSSEELFIKGLLLVTARYTFTGPLLFGLTLAQSTDPKLKQAIVDYGEAVGTAFQMQDDILGLFGDPKVTGKPVGNDVREGKKTLLVQYAYHHTTKEDQTFLEQILGKPLTPQDLEKVQAIVKDSGALDYAKELAKSYVEKGIQALEGLEESESKTTLIELARYIISRQK
ncbi:polyprenyl synthetase family protein [Candidatus Woesebacteria bacterium]|nr:polyprenyl synthetase family protein [Candidatus Woesebacteria bacterium]